MNSQTLPLCGQKKLIFWLVGLLLLAGCTQKQVFYFSAPAARAGSKPVSSPPDDSVQARQVRPPVEPAAAASLSASANEPVPAATPPVYAVAPPGAPVGVYPSAQVPVLAPPGQQQQGSRPRVGQAEPGKPKAGVARTGLLLGVASLVLGVAGLSSLTRGGGVLLPFSLLLALGGMVFSKKALSWNRKHPDDLANANGAKTGLVFSIFALGLLLFFGALVLVLF
ncbi:hypothetical protein [Rufibacter ruber]|uniref:hypothetical protein n=1 Tax=Rufibacter ruber TaxID=1783499 RepID=UPI0008302771|nr:hypothetical protein [Rufibacter ruber]